MNRASAELFVRRAFFALLIASLTGCQSSAPQPETDFDRLQGFWSGEGPGGQCSVTIAGNSLSYRKPSSDPEGEDFWYETTFTVMEDAKQIHATIVENVDGGDIGTVVVALYQLENDQLTLGVIGDFPEPPAAPVDGDWDSASDIYELERAQPSIS